MAQVPLSVRIEPLSRKSQLTTELLPFCWLLGTPGRWGGFQEPLPRISASVTKHTHGRSRATDLCTRKVLGTVVSLQNLNP